MRVVTLVVLLSGIAYSAASSESETNYEELKDAGVPTYGNEHYSTDAESGKKREEPGFPTSEKAEEAMEELLALVERKKDEIEAAVAEVDQPGLSGEKLEEIQVKALLPKLADMCEPLIKKYNIWRKKEPRKGANFMVFMSAFDKWGNQKDGKHSDQINAGLQKIHELFSARKHKSLADEL